MSNFEILASQITRSILGQESLLVRFQHPTIGRAFNHPFFGADWIGITLQGSRLIGSYGAVSRELADSEVAELLAMINEDEFEDADDDSQITTLTFWGQYADAHGLCAVQSNTDPRIICWPCGDMTGPTAGQQLDAFCKKFFLIVRELEQAA